MLLRFFFICLLTITIFNINAQPYEVGSTNIVFTDTDRNRDITTEIFYPADAMGNDVAPADGQFPIIIFGHGFSMSGDAYTNYWENVLTTECYILVFVNTETGLTVSHENYALDIRFLAAEMIANPPTLLADAVTDKIALIGHSMGGGASVAAAANNDQISTVITLAAAETSAPASAIAAAPEVNVPALHIAGSADCVVSSAMSAGGPLDIFEGYNNSSTYRVYVEIQDGTHCHFTNGDGAIPLITPAGNCYFGELGCEVNISIEDQHAATEALVLPWLRYHLKNDDTGMTEFQELSQQGAYTNYMEAPASAIEEKNDNNYIRIFPNPCLDHLNLTWDMPFSSVRSFEIYDALGNFKLKGFDDQIIDIKNWQSGNYTVLISTIGSQKTLQFIKI